MAIEQAQVAVGATRVVISTLTRDETGEAIGTHTVVVQSPDNAAGAVLLGNASLAANAYGYRLKVGGVFTIDLNRNEPLYAIAEGSAVTVNVLRAGV
jgi:hypothetical protein